MTRSPCSRSASGGRRAGAPAVALLLTAVLLLCCGVAQGCGPPQDPDPAPWSATLPLPPPDIPAGQDVQPPGSLGPAADMPIPPRPEPAAVLSPNTHFTTLNTGGRYSSVIIYLCIGGGCLAILVTGAAMVLTNVRARRAQRRPRGPGPGALLLPRTTCYEHSRRLCLLTGLLCSCICQFCNIALHACRVRYYWYSCTSCNSSTTYT